MQSSLLIRICPTTMHAVNVISVEIFPGICYFSFVIKCKEVIILKVVFYLVFCSRKILKKILREMLSHFYSSGHLANTFVYCSQCDKKFTNLNTGGLRAHR